MNEFIRVLLPSTMLLLLVASLLPIAALATCPLPLEVPEAELPPPLKKGPPFRQRNDGTRDLIDCPYLTVMQLESGSKSFTNGLVYACDTATGKWMRNGYEAPPFATFCHVLYVQPDGAWDDIAIYEGNEQICPRGQTLAFASSGINIVRMTCDDRDMTIETEDGTVTEYVYNNGQSVKCVKITSCPIKNQQANGALENIDLEPTKEQYCPSGEFIRYANGKDVKDIKCDVRGLEITGEDGGVIKYTRPDAPTLTCVATCPIRNWLSTGALENKVIEAGKEQYCPDGQIVASSDGKPLKDVKCTRAALTVETEDGRTMSYPKPLTRATLKCVPGVCKQVCAGPTTTTTTTTVVPTTTTTTVAPDRPPTANQLWNFNFYYNYNRILHAFCSDQTCINAIQANGIGYDMVSYWDVIGRAIREDSITAVRAACPTGSANLVNLGFTRVGNHYEHNFSGSGLKQGWVSTVNGACGASVAVKRWKCRMSEDMMYDSKSLETNTYYQGLVMDGGRAQFYLW